MRPFVCLGSLLFLSCHNSPTAPPAPPKPSTWYHDVVDGIHLISTFGWTDEDMGVEGVKGGKTSAILQVVCGGSRPPDMIVYIRDWYPDQALMEDNYEIHLDVIWGFGSPDKRIFWWDEPKHRLWFMGPEWRQELFAHHNTLILRIPWQDFGIVHFRFDLRDGRGALRSYC